MSTVTGPVPTTVEELIAELGSASPVFVPAKKLPAGLVAEALAAGAISEWEDSPVGRAVLLSSLTVERLGLVLVDDAGDDLFASRWVARGTERPPRSDAIDTSELFGDGRHLGSSEFDPVELAIRAEDVLIGAMQKPTSDGVEASAGMRTILGSRRPKMPPSPLVWLGSTTPGWSRSHEPERFEGRPADPKSCPTCKGLPLSPIVGCLACLRTGVDHRIPKLEKHEIPRLEPKQAPVGASSGDGKPKRPKGKKGLAGGRGASAAKSKAKARLRAR